MLSFGYAILARECAETLRRVLREELVRYAVAPKPAHGQPSVPASGVRRKAAARRDARRDDTR